MEYHIVTYCSSNYWQALESSISSWLDSDAQTVNVYTDWDPTTHPGLTIHSTFDSCDDYGTNCVRKSEALLDFCLKNPDKRHIIMLDIDCYILNNLAEAFKEECFDVGVTVYANLKPRQRLRNVSAGVLFVNNTPQARKFLLQWINNQKLDYHQTRGRDQRNLSLLLYKNPLGIRIHQFDYSVWNAHPMTKIDVQHLCDWVETLDKDCKILHLAFGLWKNKQLIGRLVHG